MKATQPLYHKNNISFNIYIYILFEIENDIKQFIVRTPLISNELEMES